MAIIFVDSTASGANNGTSWTDAYTSLNTALAAANIAPGDQVLVSGTFNETVSIAEVAAVTTPNLVQGDDKSGGAGRGVPATFTIDAQSTRANCLDSSLAADIFYVFEDMRCTGGTARGADLGAESEVTFKRCRFDNNLDDGIQIGTGAAFEHCQADNNTFQGFLTIDVTFIGCVAFANTVADYKFANGVLYGCLVHGLEASDLGMLLTTGGDVWIINCTVDGENAATTTGLDLLSGGAPTIRALINTIVYDCATGIDSGHDRGESVISIGNLVNSNTANYTNFATFTGEVTGAPAFTNEAGDDYTLGSSSPALEAGTDAGAYGGGTAYVDIGAYQRNCTEGGGGGRSIMLGG